MSENPSSGKSCKERLASLSYHGENIICNVLCGRYLGIIKAYRVIGWLSSMIINLISIRFMGRIIRTSISCHHQLLFNI